MNTKEIPYWFVQHIVGSSDAVNFERYCKLSNWKSVFLFVGFAIIVATAIFAFNADIPARSEYPFVVETSSASAGVGVLLLIIGFHLRGQANRLPGAEKFDEVISKFGDLEMSNAHKKVITSNTKEEAVGIITEHLQSIANEVLDKEQSHAPKRQSDSFRRHFQYEYNVFKELNLITDKRAKFFS